MNAPQWMGDDNRDELGRVDCIECCGTQVCPYCCDASDELHPKRRDGGCETCDRVGMCPHCGGTGEEPR